MKLDKKHEYAMVLNKKTDVYHFERCPYAKRMRKSNKARTDDADVIRRHHRPCMYCQTMRFIFGSNRDEYADYLAENKVAYKLDGHWLVLQTEVSFWKVRFDRSRRKFDLYHGNTRPTSDAVYRHYKEDYHKQTDIRDDFSLGQIISYVHKHDVFRMQNYSSYRQMPKGTKKQRKYRQQFKKSKERADRRRVYEIFRQWDERKPA